MRQETVEYQQVISWLTGWGNAYPETTGYIIPTMFDYSFFANDDDCRKRAIVMSDFLLDVQLKDGSFRLGFHPSDLDSEVFDTGQCLDGLIRCYKETEDNQYLDSAIRAADWILSVQDEDGAWRKYSFRGVPHTYYTRVALPLLKLYELNGNPKYKEAAAKNVDWAVANSNEVGWYDNCAFEPHLMSHPTTHVIGYTAEGILECGVILKNNELVEKARVTLDSLMRKLDTERLLKGTYDQLWGSDDKYSCLTGDAQIAGLWLRLYELTKKQKYYDAAVKLNNYLKSTQYVEHWCKGIEGGIKGSQPIYGKYLPYAFVNWAAKFFVDSLMRQRTIEVNEGLNPRL